MSTMAIHRFEFLTFYHQGMRNQQHNSYRLAASWIMKTDSRESKSSQARNKGNLSLDQSRLIAPQFDRLRTSNLQFDRLRPSVQEFNQRSRIEFGHFVAREAVIDEELWTAAWLRAESQWEDRPEDRYADSYKRKFTEQEFNALINRCKGQDAQRFACVVAVRKEESNIKHTVLKSVVGTLDLNIRYLLQGETFPGERVKAPLFCSINQTDPSRYGYVANLCVAKSVRRQAIASNMLHFAVESAKSNGAAKVYVQVHRNNIPAQKLYGKMGFKKVEMATSQLSGEQTFLLCYKT